MIIRLGVIVFLLSIQACLAQQYAWTQKTDFAGGLRAGCSAFSIGNKAYYSCGLDDALNAYNDLWEYDRANDSWTQKNSLPGSTRYSACGFAIGNYGYVCVGWECYGCPQNTLTDLWQYDPAANSWAAKANFTGSGRYTAIAFVIGTKAYLGTGYSPLMDDFYEYDATTDTWTILANTFPGGARQSATSFSIAFTISGNPYQCGYVCCGALNNTGTTCANDLWEFTPGAVAGSGTWSQKANFPGIARYAPFAFSINDKGYAGGGLNQTGSTNYFNDFYEYDPVLNSWSIKDSFPGSNRIHPASCTIGNAGYAGTGQFISGTFSDEMWQYAPAGIAPTINLQSSDTVFCEKQCIDFFDLSTNSPTSWQWFFTGATPDTSTQQNPTGICYNNYGTFDVMLIACNAFGCDTLSITDFITELQNPSDSIFGFNDTIWSLPYVSYQWFELNSGIINGATQQFYVPQAYGSYYCVVVDSNGCIATSNMVLITGLVNDVETEPCCAINPNPNNGTFEITLNSVFANQAYHITISNALGQMVYQKTEKNPASNASSEHSLLHQYINLIPGIYFVEIYDGKNQWRQKMIIK